MFFTELSMQVSARPHGVLFIKRCLGHIYTDLHTAVCMRSGPNADHMDHIDHKFWHWSYQHCTN